MRRAAVLLAAVLALPLAAQQPATRKVTAVQITPRVYAVQGDSGVASVENAGFNSNAGFVVTGAGVVVIDALGTPALGQELLRCIREATRQPVRRVVVTHYHADHFYGLAALTAAGADVWAHRAALEYLDGGEAGRRLEQRAQALPAFVDEAMPLVRADHWLEGDESFTLGGVRFEVLYMGPAHSPEDLVVAVPSEGVIFAGDILTSGRVPFVGQADSRLWLDRIERLLAMKPRIMVTGHGAISRQPVRDLSLTREYLRYLRETMGRAVAEFIAFDEVYASTDWSRFAKLPAFDAANRINAYGTYLLMEKELLAR